MLLPLLLPARISVFDAGFGAQHLNPLIRSGDSTGVHALLWDVLCVSFFLLLSLSLSISLSLAFSVCNLLCRIAMGLCKNPCASLTVDRHNSRFARIQG